MAVYPVILAGGGGTRLWPMSSPAEPKPFLKLANGPTLFQSTVTRGLGFADADNIRVVCGEAHKRFVKRDLEDLGLRHCAHITIEPEAKNTGPAVLLQALKLFKQDPQAVMVVLPADHVIKPTQRFVDLVKKACENVGNHLVLFGIVPDRPETGYGYIEIEEKSAPGILAPVKRFVEKPDQKTAASYLQTGRFLWNAGIFIFSAASICEEFRKHQPLMYEQVAAFIDGDSKAFGRAPKLSIDVGVMEPSNRTMVIPVDFDWSDLGNWDAISMLFEKDLAGNAMVGKSVGLACRESLLIGKDCRVAGLGLEEMVVVAANRQVLVAPRNRAADLKNLVDTLGDPTDTCTVHRPWGSFTVLDQTPGSLTKRIDILPHARTSLQKHHHRQEHWVVIQGRLRVTRNQETYTLEPGQSTLIPQGAIHRLENAGEEVVSLIEVQMGTILSEEDIVRYEDDYGRQIENPSAVSH